jgi:hypothetical protein
MYIGKTGQSREERAAWAGFGFCAFLLHPLEYFKNFD